VHGPEPQRAGRHEHAKHRPGVVGRAIVRDYHFDLLARELLGFERFEQGRQERRAIVGADGDRDARRAAQVPTRALDG
jgi:hypothetical protein